MMVVDPKEHPDLERVGRRMRARLDDILEAEQLAAATSADRRRSLRDRLLDWEDREAPVAVSTVDGQLHGGHITAVGMDHVVLTGERVIALMHIVSVNSR